MARFVPTLSRRLVIVALAVLVLVVIGYLALSVQQKVPVTVRFTMS